MTGSWLESLEALLLAVTEELKSDGCRTMLVSM